MNLTSFAEFETYLASLGLFSMRLDLGRMHEALARLGLARPRSMVVHVVGTNGKGSTAGFLDALARAHGLRCGLYTSPHLVSVRERIRINGCLLSQDQWCLAANRVLAVCLDVGLTYFELLTVLALELFARENLDLIVLEAGLGGTHDATCAVSADLTIMTPVGLDHEAVLGPTLLDIARDKSGALGRCPAVIGRQEPDVRSLFRAASAGQPFWDLADYQDSASFLLSTVSGREEERVTLGEEFFQNHPGYQVGNAGLALLAWSVLATSRGWPFETCLCTETLARTRFAGRFCRHGRIVVDGAHNNMGLAALCTALENEGAHFSVLVFQSMQDKVLDTSLLIRLAALADEVRIPAMPGLARASNPKVLARRFEPVANPVSDLGAALSGSGRILVCGSLYLVGDVYALHPEFTEF